MADVKGCKVAVLATDGVEQVELTEPVKALKQAGAQVTVVSPKGGQIQAFNHLTPGEKLTTDASLAEAKPEQFDALMLPGGVANPDQLRMQPQAVAFVKHFVDAGKPIAAICHAPWTLIEAGAVQGRRMTSWPSLRTDLRNAGANWVDEACVQDGKLVTSRKPDDLPVFNQHMLALFAGRAEQRAAAE
jgi:protease I